MDDAYNDVIVRLGSLEDSYMTNLPRIAACESRMDKISRLLSSFETRLDREHKRRRMTADAGEMQPQPAIA